MSLLVVVAHSDDETIGASYALFQHKRDARLLHATDSAPLDLAYARRAGFATREEYAAARRRELLAALKVIGIPYTRCRTLDLPDQGATRQLARLAHAIERYLRNGVTRIITHAYEGGHPDHDACAVAARLAADRVPTAELYEMPFYHQAPGHRVAGEFIAHPDAGEIEAPTLPAAAVKRKREMFACFLTQAHVFDRFALQHEPLRRAPRYDFAEPPHPGTLYYETRPLNWTGAQWRRCVQQQIKELSR